MSILTHLCKKDFTFARPWIFGTWFALLAGTFLPALMPASEIPVPWVAIRQWIPALLIFLTVTRIIHCDPFAGATGFIATRPVRSIGLLGGKLMLIASVLILPAALLTLFHPAQMGVEPTAKEYLLLFLEKGLYFAVVAAGAVLVSVLTRRVGTMAMLSIIIVLSLGRLVRMAFGRPFPMSGWTLEDSHLHASALLTLQVFLTIAAIAIAMNRAAKRGWPVTAAMFVLAAGFSIWISKGWKWNFVDHLAKDAPLVEIVEKTPTLVWLEEPTLVAYERREGVPYAHVQRPHRIDGLKDGWKAKLIKTESEARFADGTVWKSQRAAHLNPMERHTADVLTQLGVERSETLEVSFSDPFAFRVLFECEKARLSSVLGQPASIQGIGTFQLYRPVISAEMPVIAGATAVSGRKQFRINSLSALDGEISVSFATRGIAMKSKGDRAGGFLGLDLLLLNPETNQFAVPGGGGGTAGVGDDWRVIERSYRLNRRPGDANQPDMKNFLEGARLYVITVQYGGNITLPYGIPEMLLEEKR